MRSTRLTALLSLAALAAAPSLVRANCYAIYDGQNRMVFQSTVAPIDLSTRISEGMRGRFPGYFFIMTPDESDCREVRTGLTVTPRFDAGAASQRAPDELLQASPLMRGAPAAGSALSATRSGTTLNVPRR